MRAGQPEKSDSARQHRASVGPSEALVYAVVVNYCSAAQTLRCVESLRRSDYDRLRIVVVDNASPDGSETLLRTRLAGGPKSEVGSRKSELGNRKSKLESRLAGAGAKRSPGPPEPGSCKAESGVLPRPAIHALERAERLVEVIGCAQNLGFAGGANAGIHRALKAGAELVCLLSPDVLVDPQTLPCLVRAMAQDAQLGICGPVLRMGEQYISGCHMWPRLGYYARLRPAPAETAARLAPLLPTDYVDGGCMLVRSRLFGEIGLLREDFFLYYEDAEFCLRARRAGWRLAVVGGARAHTRPPYVDRNNRIYYLVRNSLWFARLEKRFLLRTLVRHMVQAAWYAWRHTWCVSHPAGDDVRSRPGPNHQQAARVLRATWQGLRAGVSRR